MSDSRHGVPQRRIADVLASITATATQVTAHRAADGTWSVTWHGDRASGWASTRTPPEPDPPRTAA